MSLERISNSSSTQLSTLYNLLTVEVWPGYALRLASDFRMKFDPGIQSIGAYSRVPLPKNRPPFSVLPAHGEV